MILKALCLMGALGPAGPYTPVAPPAATLVQARRGLTCKQMPDCRSAVILWCSGYGRADGDGDGIPCENVCSSRRQVEAILREIGCDK
ncbi:excalibur calcium-binding domain-containing protein [Stappia indica]|nr:excalibur calcium-binding domain-containing protein [Stappia indica]